MPDRATSGPRGRRRPPAPARRIVIAGASGLIGRALTASLEADGIAVTRLVRRPAERDGEVEWHPGSAPLDPDVLAGARAVVGLSGASVGRFPWTPRYRSTLLWSRIAPTRTLATALRHLGSDAPAFVNASAVGYYGTRGANLTESSPAGSSFLARLCVAWEREARRAGDAVRTVLLRTAPIVHPEGVLAPLILLTKLGLAGPIGRGTQIWPWISLDDHVAAVRHLIDTDAEGPANLTGPTRASANDLGFALARQLNRPYLLRAPATALRLALTPAAADALLLCDTEVRPEALVSSGFAFTHTTVEDAVAAAVPAAA